MACETESSLLCSQFAGQKADASGWTFEPLGGYPAPDQASPATLSEAGIAVPDGRRLVSPRIDLEPHAFYCIAITATAKAPASWGVKFFDADGSVISADHYGGLDPQPTPGTQTFYFRQRYNGQSAVLWLHQGEDQPGDLVIQQVSITPATSEAVLGWADAVYAQLPEIRESVTTHAVDQLPRAVARLKAGQPLRIVMVGDSLQNDTSNSAFDLLLERAFPRSDVQIFEAVRGGGSAANFRRQEDIDNEILGPKPHVVVIGGISHKNNLRAVRLLIDRIKAGSDAEILLATGPGGRMGHPDYVNPDDPTWQWLPVPDPGSSDWRLRMKALASEQGLGYVDFETPWRLYARRVDQPYEHFMRDPIHLNARGRQIVARLVMQFFGE